MESVPTKKEQFIVPCLNNQIYQYQVQAIVGRKTTRDRILYKVLWKNYSIEQATWEPISNLKNAWESIKKFEKSARDLNLKKQANSQNEVEPPKLSNTYSRSQEQQFVLSQIFGRQNNHPNKNFKQDKKDQLKSSIKPSEKNSDKHNNYSDLVHQNKQFISMEFKICLPVLCSSPSNQTVQKWPIYKRNNNPLENMYHKCSKKLHTTVQQHVINKSHLKQQEQRSIQQVYNHQGSSQNIDCAKVAKSASKYSDLKIQEEQPQNINKQQIVDQQNLENIKEDKKSIEPHEPFVKQNESEEFIRQELEGNSCQKGQISKNLNQLWQKQQQNILLSRLSPNSISKMSKFKILPSDTVIPICQKDDFMMKNQAKIGAILRIGSESSKWIIQLMTNNIAQYYDEETIQNYRKDLLIKYFSE